MKCISAIKTKYPLQEEAEEAASLCQVINKGEKIREMEHVLLCF